MALNQHHLPIVRMHGFRSQEPELGEASLFIISNNLLEDCFLPFPMILSYVFRGSRAQWRKVSTWEPSHPSCELEAKSAFCPFWDPQTSKPISREWRSLCWVGWLIPTIREKFDYCSAKAVRKTILRIQGVLWIGL